MIVLLALMGLQFAVAAPAAAAVAPKVAIIVGPSGSLTATNLSWGRAAAAEARHYTTNVVEVYTPRATWAKAKAAMNGASVVVYIGRGRGFPSPYSTRLNIATEDGFGLNPRSGHGNSTTRFYGEKYIRTANLAPNAVVILSHLAYASGGSEIGRPAPTQSVARKRVSNYAAPFLAAGATAVIADQFHAPLTYIRGIFTRDATLDTMWRTSSGHYGHVRAFISSRGHGVVARTDTRLSASGYYRSIVGSVLTVTASVRLGIPLATPPPPAPPSSPSAGSTGVYGTGINADTKAQIQVGGTDTSSSNNRVAHRFRASTTSAVTSVRFAQRRGAGYSGGSGGTMRISIRADDGSGRPSGTMLASASYTPGSSGINTFDRVTFSSPARLTKGHIYYVVFENTNSSPRSNFISVNETFIYGSVLSPRQPRYTDGEYAVLTTGRGSWAVEGRYTADMDVAYSNGVHDGNGYVAAQIDYYGTISGSSSMVRERFTVSGSSRTIRTVAVRMRRSSGSSPLLIRLESSSGALIDSVSIPASSVPASSPGGDNGGQVWVKASFDTSHTLSKGSTYNLRLSTASGTTYTATPIREGTDVGFRSFVFSDGLAQRTTNGSSWAALYQWAGLDLQFYLK
jgi:hypothetical protein